MHSDVDVVLDTIGGETLARSFEVLKPGGILVFAVATPDQEEAVNTEYRPASYAPGVIPAAQGDSKETRRLQ